MLQWLYSLLPSFCSRAVLRKWHTEWTDFLDEAQPTDGADRIMFTVVFTSCIKSFQSPRCKGLGLATPIIASPLELVKIIPSREGGRKPGH